MRRLLVLGLLVSFVALGACKESTPAAEAPDKGASTQVLPDVVVHNIPKDRPQIKTGLKKEFMRPKKAADDKPADSVASADSFIPAELPPVQVPTFDYPEFSGKKLAIIHSENVIGELEACG